jgi:hypothetical protein
VGHPSEQSRGKKLRLRGEKFLKKDTKILTLYLLVDKLLLWMTATTTRRQRQGGNDKAATTTTATKTV